MYKPRLQLWERSAHPKVARTETDTVTTTKESLSGLIWGREGLLRALTW